MPLMIKISGQILQQCENGFVALRSGSKLRVDLRTNAFVNEWELKMKKTRRWPEKPVFGSEEGTPPPPPAPPPAQTKMTDPDGRKGKLGRWAYYSRYTPTNPRRAFCGCITVFLLLAAITVLVLWLVYRPEKPRFTVVSVAVLNLNNTSPPPLISATMQFTVVTRNPNDRVSIYYEHIWAFVTYHNQMITQPVLLPPLYHEKHTTVEMAPILGGGDGAGVPVTTEVAYELGMEEAYGVVGLRLVLLGKLRWKAGAIRTGRRGFTVKCDVFVRLSKGFVGQVPFASSPVCQVDI